MFGMKHKVQAWCEAGLIDPAQADAIFAHEQAGKRGTFGRNLAATAVLTIILGIASIIASNWNDIPADAKIGGHVALNMAVAIVAWFAAVRGNVILREGAVLAFFGLSLTILALIGQVFQLEGAISDLLVLWMVMTLPFIAFFGRTRLTAVPWMIGFLVTITVVMSEYLPPLPDFWQICFIYGVGTFLPLGLIGDGSLRVFQRLKPCYAEIFTRTGFGLLAINASIASLYWTAPRTQTLMDNAHDVGLTYTQGYLILAGIFMVAILGIAVHAMVCRFYRDQAERRAGLLFVIVSLLMIALPILIPGGEMTMAAALIFILYWVFIGWLGQMLAWSRLISLAITLIALRIFAIYLEVFGTLLDTGVGLIAGGTVALGLIWAARKMNRAVKAGGIHG